MNPEPKHNLISETKTLTEKSRALQEPTTISACGMELVLYPHVFDPSIFFSSCWFSTTISDYIARHQIKTFCEVGTGTGIVGLTAALNNVSLTATLCDLNPDAVNNARANVEKYTLLSRIEVVQSDVFSGLIDKTFGAIFWSLPFGYVSPETPVDIVDVQTFDPGYTMIDRYFKDAETYLNQNGTLLFGFSPEIGHWELIEQIAAKYGWKLTLVSEHTGIEKSGVTMQLYSAVK